MSQVHVVSALAENSALMCNRVVSMLRSRGFRYESLTITPSMDSRLLRFTVVVWADEATLAQVVKQFGKLIGVVNVKAMDPKRDLCRELALVRIFFGDASARPQVLASLEKFHGRVLDDGASHISVQIAGSREAVDAFIQALPSHCRVELSRSGTVALPTISSI